MGFSTFIAAIGVATMAATTPLAACEFEAASTGRPVVAEVQSGTQLNGIRVNGVRANGIRINGPTPGAAPPPDAKDVTDSGGFQPLTVILPDGRGLIAE